MVLLGIGRAGCWVAAFQYLRIQDRYGAGQLSLYVFMDWQTRFRFLAPRFRSESGACAPNCKESLAVTGCRSLSHDLLSWDE